MSLRIVEFLNKVSMLPLISLSLFQHVNVQHISSPAPNPFYAGEIKLNKLWLKKFIHTFVLF